MKTLLRIVCALCLLTVVAYAFSSAQAENVPAYHPVYEFLKRMEVRGVIERYHDAVIPISRREVAEYLTAIDANKDDLTTVDRDILLKYLAEFQFDRTGSFQGSQQFLNFSDQTLSESFMEIFSDKEKYLYAYHDSTLNFFVDGLLTVDGRRSNGDPLGSEGAEYVQFGGRIRGTIHNHLGYYLQGTNAQFWGSRKVLARDKFLSQDYTLGVGDAQNFDHVEGYLQYDASPVSVQIGRERMLWGNGYGDKLLLSDNIRPFDALRFDAHYKSVKYTFLHGVLLGNKSSLLFSLPSDPSTQFVEPVTDDKYIVAHRIEVSFPHAIDVGFQEIMIYSNRSIDLAYFNPLQLLESTQRNRDERDNAYWAFDFQAHWIPGWEIQGTIDFDDIAFSKWGTNKVQNKFAYQAGIMGVDPLGIPNTTIALEYTKIDPFTFSHSRSRDNNYSSGGRMLGHHIGPNSDSWFIEIKNSWTHRLRTSLSYENVRHGVNIYAHVPGGADTLVLNVGGDIFQPIRPADSQFKNFLGGNFQRTQYVHFFTSYELFRKLSLEGWYRYSVIDNVTLGNTSKNSDFGVDLRLDF